MRTSPHLSLKTSYTRTSKTYNFPIHPIKTKENPLDKTDYSILIFLFKSGFLNLWLFLSPLPITIRFEPMSRGIRGPITLATNSQSTASLSDLLGVNESLLQRISKYSDAIASENNICQNISVTSELALIDSRYRTPGVISHVEPATWPDYQFSGAVC